MPTFGKKERLRAGRRRGRLNTRHSESGVWPPTEWKPLEECPQVKLGIIDPKIYDLDLQQFHADDNARIFLHQLRDSRMPTFGKKERFRAGRRRGRVITRDSSSGVWPPTEWKPLEECPQIEEGILDLETYELDLNKFHPDDDDVRIFLQQLRNSRGYELEINAPKRVSVALWLVPPSAWVTDPQMMDKLQFVTKHINALAEKHDEKYELVEPVKLVESLPSRCDLYTFNVRQVVPENHDALKTVQAMVRTSWCGEYELLEWRFRPGPPQTPPELLTLGTPPSTTTSSSDDSPKDYGIKSIAQLTLETPTDTASSSSDDSPKDYGIKSIGNGIF